MDYRSTSAVGFVHFGGDVIAGADAGIGVQVTIASTGSTAWIETRSNDTAANFGLRAQGAGTLTLGTSSNGLRISNSSVNIASTQVRVGSTASSIVIGNSTTFLTGIQRYLVQFAPPALAASAAEDSTFTVTGATTNGVYIFTPADAFSTQYVMSQPRCSTADEIIIRFSNPEASTIGTGESTNRGTLVHFKF